LCTDHGRWHLAVTSSRGWRWRRPCASRAGACTGWVRPTQHGKPPGARAWFCAGADRFSGVRGKGLRTLAALPWRLLKACAQSVAVLRRVRPDVVVGLGGYITFPAGVMARSWASRWCCMSKTRWPAWPTRCWPSWRAGCSPHSRRCWRVRQWVGNPLARPTSGPVADPATRFVGRSGPLQVLVVGGSLGAKALNDRGAAVRWRCCRPNQRPAGHHTKAAQIDELTHCAPTYVPDGGVRHSSLTPFIEDTAQAFADADLVICRAGASTVTELAAVVRCRFAGAAAVGGGRSPDTQRQLPGQTRARHGWCRSTELTPEKLADLLQKTERSALRPCER
jgi:UDP-N-acetylglucosamine--N-acetylmuramyl-(pentapeptide) pyrophosphoryl-undecaprenol N-acetylglucosamine transferase